MNITVRPEHQDLLFEFARNAPAGQACSWHYSWRHHPRCVPGATVVFRVDGYGMIARAVVEGVHPPEFEKRRPWRKRSGWRITFLPETLEDMRPVQWAGEAVSA